MKVTFIGPRIIEKQYFAKGQHTLTKEVIGHWYTKALIKCGDIVPVESEKPKEQSKLAPKDPVQIAAVAAAKARVEAGKAARSKKTESVKG